MTTAAATMSATTIGNVRRGAKEEEEEVEEEEECRGTMELGESVLEDLPKEKRGSEKWRKKRKVEEKRIMKDQPLERFMVSGFNSLILLDMALGVIL